MTFSQACIDLIKRSEGCQLSSYRDSVGVWTIGWGHTGPEVGPGMVCTQEQADDQLAADVQSHAELMQALVTVPLTQGQFDALTDFVYNMGAGKLQTSTLLAVLNAGNYSGARQMLYWVDGEGKQHGWIYAGGVILPGLVTRRKAEQELWNS